MMPQTKTALAKQAERVMQRWLNGEQVRQRIEESLRRESMLSQSGPYIVLSREAGLEASSIARLLGEKLDWEVLDHELLELMAGRYHTPTQLLEFVDEKPANWFSDILNQAIAHRNWSSATFVHRVAKILQLAGYQGNVVIVGRGAQYILPRENGFFVRLIGSREYRVARVARRDGLLEDQAAKYIDKLDRTRVEFIRQHFHCDVRDAHQYDLVLNVARFGPDNTARQIAAAFRIFQEYQTTKAVASAIN